MMQALKAITGNNNQASARVVDGKLILSFPHAITPVVWQMDLAQVKASALEVLHNEDKNHFTLTLKTPKGEKLDAATFETREDAVAGLMAASHALENGHGRICKTIAANEDTGIAMAQSTPKQKNPGRWVAGILCALLLVALLGIWGSIAPQSPQSYNASSPSSANTAQSASPANAAGVPVSADDFLNGL